MQTSAMLCHCEIRVTHIALVVTANEFDLGPIEIVLWDDNTPDALAVWLNVPDCEILLVEVNQRVLGLR